jgi:pimeloyl-ACP methyl ester carboxylesterase
VEPQSLEASEVEVEAMDEDNDAMSLLSKTGGGAQFWTDHEYRGGYRIQQNALTGHRRLIHAKNDRQGWGTKQQCESTLEQLCPLSAATKSKHVVVLLHGLMRTRGSMKSLETQLRQEMNVDVIRFSYASTRASIADHAQALRDVLEHLPTDTQFSFVGHSMGNIVVRHLLKDLEKNDPKGLLSRFRSMVMLGPPNQGASIARRLAPTGVFGWVTGKGGLELGPKWQDLQQRLATPSFPFAIIAGDLSHNPIQNPLVDGSSDLIVTVDEARLDGAQWLRTVPVIHSLLMNDEAVQRMTFDFIKEHAANPSQRP